VQAGIVVWFVRLREIVRFKAEVIRSPSPADVFAGLRAMTLPRFAWKNDDASNSVECPIIMMVCIQPTF